MDERRETIALFWYDLLNPLLREGLDQAEKRKLMDEITSQEHVIPYSTKRTVTAATVRRRLRAFRDGGFRALAPAVRADMGKPRAVPDVVLQRALELKAELPTRSVRTIVELLQHDPALPAVTVALSTLSRHLKDRGYTRKALVDPKRGTLFRKFQRERINSLWQGDAMHGPRRGLRPCSSSSVAFGATRHQPRNSCGSSCAAGQIYDHPRCYSSLQ